MEPTEQTSLTLLAKISANHPDAWERFVHLYAPLVYSWGRNAGLQPEDVADVAQEVFHVVSVKIQSFEPGRKTSGGFRSWLWGITRLRILESLRSDRRQPQASGGPDEDHRLRFLQAEIQPSVNGITTEQRVVQSAMKILQAESEPATWQAFWRMAVDGRSARETGDELGMTAKAVRQAKFRVARKLRLLLHDEFPGQANRPQSVQTAFPAEK